VAGRHPKKSPIMKSKTALFLMVFAACMFIGGSAAAQGSLAVNCGGEGQPACDICSLFSLINNIINVVLKLIVPAAAALIIAWAGFKMATNQESSDVIKQTREIVIFTLVGLVIIYAGAAIVDTVLKSLGYLGADWKACTR